MITMDTSIHNARQLKLMRCNECKQVLRVDQCREHMATCPQIRQREKLSKMTLERDGMRLHAIACARYVSPQNYNLEIHYVHAENVAHARAQFCWSHPDRQKANIMAVGLVIGWNTNEDGKILVH